MRIVRLQVVALTAAVAVVASACTPASHSAGSPGSPSSAPPVRTVTFPLPAPGAGSDAKLLPKPAPDPGGTVLAAATKLAKQTSGGGRAGLAALLTALKRGGAG